MNPQATASHAQRASIQLAVAARADELLHAEDLLPYLDSHERGVRLSAAAGDVCTDIYLNDCADLDEVLLRLAAETVLWLEARERERAAA